MLELTTSLRNSQHGCHGIAPVFCIFDERWSWKRMGGWVQRNYELSVCVCHRTVVTSRPRIELGASGVNWQVTIHRRATRACDRLGKAVKITRKSMIDLSRLMTRLESIQSNRPISIRSVFYNSRSVSASSMANTCHSNRVNLRARTSRHMWQDTFKNTDKLIHNIRVYNILG